MKQGVFFHCWGGLTFFVPSFRFRTLRNGGATQGKSIRDCKRFFEHDRAKERRERKGHVFYPFIARAIPCRSALLFRLLLAFGVFLELRVQLRRFGGVQGQLGDVRIGRMEM